MNTLNQMSKLNQILLVLLIIQIALGAIVFWPSNAASESGGLLFVDLKAGDVVELTISDGDNNRTTLVKQGEGWALPEAGDYPANGESIIALLEKIEGIQTNRLVTKTDASHKRLQVADDDFNRQLEITLANGTTHRLFIGSSGGGNATHVRAAGRSEVYLAGGLNAWDANAQVSGWIDTLYFEVPQTDITALTLENGNGVFQFEKAGENWTLTDLTGDEIFNENALTTLLGQVSSVRMTTPIGKEKQASFGLDNPLATVTLQTTDQTYTLRVGAQNPDDNNSYVFSASNSPYFVRVAAFTGDSFVNKTRADFLQAPPTPEAGDGSTESQ